MRVIIDSIDDKTIVRIMSGYRTGLPLQNGAGIVQRFKDVYQAKRWLDGVGGYEIMKPIGIYHGLKAYRSNRLVYVYSPDWVPMFDGFTMRNLDDVRTVVDHHLAAICRK
jgi:hypothetical protein